MIALEEKFSAWLARDPDPATRATLQQLLDENNTAKLEDCFSDRLAFGTAGLRGVVGVGPNRMNRLVVRETTAGLGRYLEDTVPNALTRGVIIAFDARPDSRTFAEDTACTLAAMGFRIWLTREPSPTPLAAFGVRHLGCAAAIVVTASHNPPQYNGYKVYWGNGAQIVPPVDAGIAAAIEVAARQELPWIDLPQAQGDDSFFFLDGEFEDTYLHSISTNRLFDQHVDSTPVSIAYTPLHGVGAKLAEKLLSRSGFTVHTEASQREPDGSFPTVDFPNPEEPGAMDAVLALARSQQATIACANDPDADRLAVAVRDSSGEYVKLTGDMTGALLGDYLLRKPCDFIPVTCTTIVSSRLLSSIAAAAGAQHHETLTGFKWLANTALNAEDASHLFLFAYEEALGYACGREVMDKDGISALLAVAQLTAELSSEGKTLLDHLETIYRQHGIFLSKQVSLALDPNASAPGGILRQQPPESIAGEAITRWDDLESGIRSFSDGRQEALTLPTSDVLIYYLENDARVIVRPSGTEPKLKCYYEVIQSVGSASFSDAMDSATASLDQLSTRHQAELARAQA